MNARPGRFAGGREPRAFAKARYGCLQAAEAAACLRARPTDSLCAIPATEFVDIRSHFTGIKEHVRYSCCDTVDKVTRHAHICPRAGAQV